MKDRLICCIYILFDKQYAVFTVDKYKMWRFGHCSIRAENKAFLHAIIEWTKTVDSRTREVCNEENNAQ